MDDIFSEFVSYWFGWMLKPEVKLYPSLLLLSSSHGISYHERWKGESSIEIPLDHQHYNDSTATDITCICINIYGIDSENELQLSRCIENMG